MAPNSEYLAVFSLMEITFRRKSLICDWSEMNELRLFCSELVLGLAEKCWEAPVELVTLGTLRYETRRVLERGG